jgi:hypothetical protein
MDNHIQINWIDVTVGRSIRVTHYAVRLKARLRRLEIAVASPGVKLSEIRQIGHVRGLIAKVKDQIDRLNARLAA